MARVMVHIETDHENLDEAVRSVSNALKRAGYDLLDAQVEGNSASSSAHAIRSTTCEFVMYADPALVTAAEPETDARYRK